MSEQIKRPELESEALYFSHISQHMCGTVASKGGSFALRQLIQKVSVVSLI